MTYQGAALKRVEALLNEYKGNLYEFLVAKALAQKLSIEESFLRGLSENMFHMLGVQESFIRSYYPQLIADLDQLASKMSLDLVTQLETKYQSKLQLCKIDLVGKISDQQVRDQYGEADLILTAKKVTTNEHKILPISLKLSRKGAFVNSKSAGPKSFISKYFAPFDKKNILQEELNKEFDRLYQLLAWKMQELKGLEPDFEFKSWRDQGLPELPGALDDDGRKLFLETVSSMNNLLFERLKAMHSTDSKVFVKSLLPLIGIASADIIQATTYYEKSVNDNYVGGSNRIEFGQDVIKNLKLIELRNNQLKTSFDLIFEDRILQIRLKAMNKFTTKGYKVNCAFKQHSF